MRIKLSKSQWTQIGKNAGWFPIDLGERTDADLPPALSPDDEENILLGEKESITEEMALKSAFNDGYEYGCKHSDTLGCPWKADSKRAEAWFNGFKKAREEKERKK